MKIADMKITATLMLLILIPGFLFSQKEDKFYLVSKIDSFEVKFSDNSSSINHLYLDNKEVLNNIQELLIYTKAKEIDSICIITKRITSERRSNKIIYKRRAKAIYEFFNTHYPHLNENKFIIKESLVDNNIIVYYYKRDYNVEYIHNLNSLSEKQYQTKYQDKLEKLRDSLNNSFDTTTLETSKVQTISTIAIYKDTIKKITKRNYFSYYLKTNLLYYLALSPNIEVEIPYKNFSINFDYMFPWYVDTPKRYCYQLLIGGIEGRYWIKNKTPKKENNPLLGFFVGGFLQRGIFDFQTPEFGVQGDIDYLYGISFGLSKEISNHFNLEFSLGFGYFNSKNTYYYPYDELLIRKNSSTYSYFGPTKAKVSLSWRINYSKPEKSKN